MPYQWDGTKILQKNTDFKGLRSVVGHPDVEVRTDIRQWLVGSEMAEIKRVLRAIDGLPRTKERGEFDLRAGLVWQWVSNHITYTQDIESQRRTEFYQFPSETIALECGDCEDSAFLLASLLIASGISEYCVRAVLGSVKWEDNRTGEGHAWVVYKDESGIWRLLDPTISQSNSSKPIDPWDWPAADVSSKRGARPWYVPEICMNQSHV